MNIFEQQNNKGLNPNSNLFDMAHEVKLSLNAGNLTPVMLMECMPGDKFRNKDTAIVRAAPMVSPVMHRINAKVNYYFVPWRLIWDNFEGWITGRNQAAIMPQIKINQATQAYFEINSLADYLGIPPVSGLVDNGVDLRISQLPFRAFQLVVEEHYINQNLHTPITIPKDDVLIQTDTTDLQNLTMMRRVQWEKDYFTSALEKPQFGESVGIPVEFAYKDEATIVNKDGHAIAANGVLTHSAEGKIRSGSPVGAGSGSNEHVPDAYKYAIENLDTEAVQVTIEQLRWTERLQEWAERMMRLGRRYIDVVRGTFGVRSSDSRLDRPEYLGGGNIPISVSEVLNTSDTSNAVQGEMSGHGIGVGDLNWSYNVEEHGYIIGIMHILPKTAYMQGIDKTFFLEDKNDLVWPDFVNLGYQAIQNKEIFVNTGVGGTAINDATFGYIPRYSQYKYAISRVAGDFRSSLAHWHWARQFNLLPTLSEEFITAEPNFDIFAIEDSEIQHFYVMMYHDCRVIRKLPYFNVPQL